MSLGSEEISSPDKFIFENAEIIQRDGDLLKFKVEAHKVTIALNEIFKKLEVSDVKIEEEDIADVIENLMKRDRSI
jgi:ABC-type uncharacterized transport system ATPase subunit